MTMRRTTLTQADLLRRFENLSLDHPTLHFAHEGCRKMVEKLKETKKSRDHSISLLERFKGKMKNLKKEHGESINVQNLETNLYWEFGKFTSRDDESLESYYSRFYKMMNELVRNQCDVTNHQVNVQFLLQLQPEWQRKSTNPTNNQPQTSSNTSRANQIILQGLNRGTGTKNDKKDQKNIYGSPTEKVEGHGDWDAPEYTDTTGSKEKKVTKALNFYKMETDKVSERYIAPYFVNGLDAYDGEINLALDENLISNEFAVKLCLDYEVKEGNKVMKKELIVALRGELYFVKFIINPKEDDVEPRVILGRSFMRLVNGIIDFSSGVITVYPEQDPFIDDYEKIEKSMDDWDQLFDFNFDDIPQLDGEEL
ncbi:hypothetical protein Tco_0740083 [Tanacetum coccineum]